MFDVNTQSTFEKYFNLTDVYEEEETTYIWQSSFTDHLGEALITAFINQEYDYKKEQVKIVEKYHSSDTIRALLKKNKMMIVDVYGYKDRRFDVLSDEVDNLKLLFVAKKL